MLLLCCVSEALGQHLSGRSGRVMIRLDNVWMGDIQAQDGFQIVCLWILTIDLHALHDLSNMFQTHGSTHDGYINHLPSMPLAVFFPNDHALAGCRRPFGHAIVTSKTANCFNRTQRWREKIHTAVLSSIWDPGSLHMPLIEMLSYASRVNTPAEISFKSPHLSPMLHGSTPFSQTWCKLLAPIWTTAFDAADHCQIWSANHAAAAQRPDLRAKLLKNQCSCSRAKGLAL